MSLTGAFTTHVPHQTIRIRHRCVARCRRLSTIRPECGFQRSVRAISLTAADPIAPCRGAEPFVRVEWDHALDLVANELKRVKRGYGDPAIFAGSYGRDSAGRVHHLRSLLKRLLKLHGEFTDHVLDYSRGAALVIVPHVVGGEEPVGIQLTAWDSGFRELPR